MLQNHHSDSAPSHASEPTLYETYCRPELGQLLRTLVLDVEYVKASGDTLVTKEGKHVLDFLGGYGSTILGHNPPEIRAAIQDFLNREAPIQAQASARVEAGKLAQQLNHLLCERFGTDRGKFLSLFLSTGTEAVEAAIKHALMSWAERRAQLDRKLERLENSLLQKEAHTQIPQTHSALKGLKHYRNLLQNGKPVLLALEGSYHGKTAGSLAVTANATYGKMYPGKSVEVIFLPRNATAAEIEGVLAEHRVSFMEEEDGSFSLVAGAFVEWIQGEGGIHPISQKTAHALSRALSLENIPLIADEIQTGLYRTGKLLASEHLGVSPDYLLLGKSLGGGYAKISSLSIRESVYVPEFGRLHTSTFADDDFSCHLARVTLHQLTHDTTLSSRALAFEHTLRTAVEEIQNLYPGVIREIRGQGWMLGIEFNLDLNQSAPQLLNAVNQTGYTLYAFSSWLLHRHGVRVAATLNRACTLRLEPSSRISENATLQLVRGLTELCKYLSEGRIAELFSPTLLGHSSLPEKPLNLVSTRRETPTLLTTSERKVTFLSHLIDSKMATRLDPALGSISESRREQFIDDIAPLAGSVVYHQQAIEGENGQSVLLELRGITCTSKYFEKSIRSSDGEAQSKVHEAAQLALDEGASTLGLGQFTSIVTDNGVSLRQLLPLDGSGGVALTTGNSLTVGLAYRAILRVLAERGRSLETSRVAIIGAAGNICSVYAQLLAPFARELVLIHREPLELSRKFQKAYHEILQGSGVPEETLRSKITTTHLLDEVSTCDVVISGTNSTRQFLESRHLKLGAIVLDIGVPSNIHPSVLTDRSDVECFQGGYAALPKDQKLRSPLVPASNGEIFACMAETLALGLAGRTRSLSIGALSRESVLESLSVADSVGIKLGTLKRMAAF